MFGLQIDTLAWILVSLFFMLTVIRRPKLFWPLLIVANVIGNGPPVEKYCLLDEMLSWAVISGALLRSLVTHGTRSKTDSSSSRHGIMTHQRLVFILWIGYMIMESIIGIIVNEDLRIIRWVLFYVELGVLASILYHRGREFPFPPLRQVCLLILIPFLFYNLAYLGYGMMYDTILGQYGRFGAQFLKEGFMWSGTALAAFPNLIALPAALYVLNDRSLMVRLLAWGSIVLISIVAFYYDSRVSYVMIFAFFLVSLPKIGFRRSLLYLIFFGIVFVIYIPDLGDNTPIFFKTLFESTQLFWNPPEDDINRKLQWEAAIMRVTDNIKTFFIGDGVYTHRFTIIPYINELYEKYLPEQKFLVPLHEDPGKLTIFRTTAFSATLIDTGIIGTCLFYMNYLFVAGKVLMQKTGSAKITLLLILFIAFSWAFVNNISDVFLLYLLIMPKGFVEQWSRASAMKYEPIPT